MGILTTTRNALSRVYDLGRTVVRGSVTTATLASMAAPEIRGIDKLVEAMREDYQVQMVERVILSKVKSLTVTLECNSTDPRALALSGRIQTLWETYLDSMLECFAYGRVAYEKVWDYADAVTFIRKLEALPHDKTRLKLDASGAFDGVKLGGKGEDGADLPADKSWWLALDAKPLEPHGRSRFLGAPYKVWQERREVFKLRSLHTRRFTIRGFIAHVPPTLPDPQRPGQNIDNIQLVAQQIEQLLSGAAMICPNTQTTPGTDDYRIDSPQITDPTPLYNLVSILDAELTRAFGVSEKVLIEGDTQGSHAETSIKDIAFWFLVEDILKQILSSFQRYIIDKMVDVNFEAGTVSIKATFKSHATAMMLAGTMPNGSTAQAGEGVEGGAGSVQALALNGAQTSSMQAIGAGLADGTLNAETARVMLEVSFPSMTPDQIDRFVAPFAGGAAQQQQAGSGTLVGVGRRDWKNISKAVNDVLDQFASGVIDESRARVELGRLGYSDAEASKVLSSPAALSIEQNLTEDVAA